ncbi:hypothetical protein A0H81_05911 [Grifola frondosa]|uniref:Uncharacterized protein n=1 Tax=Grifola frondosa TaxID=5627 RepID=A0A1C7MAN2_GRIFR|nr:hypothetical protein A0H81_05911 [Grifola frondosa]
MQSANGEVDQSLGLVRNVPFQVSDIVLYLQITSFDRLHMTSYWATIRRFNGECRSQLRERRPNNHDTLPNTIRRTVPTLRRGPRDSKGIATIATPRDP